MLMLPALQKYFVNSELISRLDSALPMQRHDFVFRFMKGRFFTREEAVEAVQAVGLDIDRACYAVILCGVAENWDWPLELSGPPFDRFQEVTGMGEGKLYRSSSPVNPEINRNQQSDAAAADAGVRTFINLADNDETMKGYEGFADTYYAKQNIIGLNLGVDFAADDFKAGLAEGFRFIAANEAPYLVHCTEGKDRAGFVSAVLEALMGAGAEEITADYMVTYYNYYGVQPGTEQYSVIAASNIQKSLASAFGMASIFDGDLKAAAEQYLAGIGLSAEEIAAVQANLGQ